MRLAVILAFLTTVSLFACGESESKPTPPASPANARDQLSGWQLFSRPSEGMQLNYPPNWVLKVDGATHQFASSASLDSFLDLGSNDAWLYVAVPLTESESPNSNCDKNASLGSTRTQTVLDGHPATRYFRPAHTMPTNWMSDTLEVIATGGLKGRCYQLMLVYGSAFDGPALMTRVQSGFRFLSVH